jgi:hypothetical protein
LVIACPPKDSITRVHAVTPTAPRPQALLPAVGLRGLQNGRRCGRAGTCAVEQHDFGQVVTARRVALAGRIEGPPGDRPAAGPGHATPISAPEAAGH